MRTFIYLTLLSTLLLATSCNNRKKGTGVASYFF